MSKTLTALSGEGVEASRGRVRDPTPSSREYDLAERWTNPRADGDASACFERDQLEPFAFSSLHDLDGLPPRRAPCLRIAVHTSR